MQAPAEAARQPMGDEERSTATSTPAAGRRRLQPQSRKAFNLLDLPRVKLSQLSKDGLEDARLHVGS